MNSDADWRMYGPDPIVFGGHPRRDLSRGSLQFPSPQHLERYMRELRRWWKFKDEQRAAEKAKEPTNG